MRTFISILVGLGGGLGLFLHGTQLLSEGLRKAAGDRMRRLLELFTSKPVTAVLTGAGVTAILQSSSTVTVMIVGFVNSGLMTLKQAVGSIMGANIGTTITAQIVSFNVYDFALPLIAIGALVYFFAKNKARNVGLGLLGFGMLLFGLSIMSDATYPVREYEPFLNLLASMGSQPLLGILVGAIFTGIVQSSSAVTGIVIAFAWQGIIDLPAGLAITVGANIGTCVTALLTAIGTNLTARRAAVSHFLFNSFGAVLFLVLRRPFIELIAHSGGTIARQIANAHTLFNVTTTLVVLPFLNPFVQLVTKLLPGEDEIINMKPQFLDDRMIRTPAALLSAQREAVRMGEYALSMTEAAMEVFKEGNIDRMDEIRKKEEVVNSLEKAITAYLARANQYPLGDSQSRHLTNYMHVVNDIERIGDHAINIAELGIIRVEGNLELSQAALDDLDKMTGVVTRIYRETLDSLKTRNAETAQRLIAEDDLVDDLEKKYRANHIERLNKGQCDAEVGVLFLDVISNLERIGDHANNISEAVVNIATDV